MKVDIRGKPCQDTANAPTTKNSTLFEFKHSTNRRKSRLSGIRSTPLLKCQEDLDSLFGRHATPSLIVRRIGFRERLEDAKHFVHQLHFSFLYETATGAEACGWHLALMMYRNRAALAGEAHIPIERLSRRFGAKQ